VGPVDLERVEELDDDLGTLVEGERPAQRTAATMSGRIDQYDAEPRGEVLGLTFPQQPVHHQTRPEQHRRPGPVHPQADPAEHGLDVLVFHGPAPNR
jgi:hypothetical protein